MARGIGIKFEKGAVVPGFGDKGVVAAIPRPRTLRQCDNITL
jgi:hypothetical protein